MTTKLNARQELFVQGLLAGKTAGQAYADAGYKPNAPHGGRLAKNGKILARLEELRKPVVQSVQMTLEGHLRDLQGLRNMATTAKQFGAAIAAEISRGKAAGLYVERKLIGVRHLEKMTNDELADLLGAIETEIGASEGSSLAHQEPAGRA